MSQRLRVYVAGPYTKPDPDTNTDKAIAVANHLLDAGFAPFVPHLTHFWEQRHHRPYEDWMQLDVAWVAVCDALLRMPGESSGADREVALAKELGIPVYMDVEELIAKPPVKGDARFHASLKRIGQLHDAKQADYGTAADAFANYHSVAKYGIEPWRYVAARTGEKLNRLQSYCQKGFLVNESVSDSLRDIAVQALIVEILRQESQEGVLAEQANKPSEG